MLCLVLLLSATCPPPAPQAEIEPAASRPAGTVRSSDAASADPLTEPERLWNAGERLAAIDAAQALLTRRPNDEPLLDRLITWELTVHRYAAALERILSCSPERRARYDTQRGQALYALTRYEAALPFLGDDQPLARLDALEALGRSDAADAALANAARRLGEEHPEVACARAKRLAAQGDAAGAAQRYRAVVAADPTHAAALYGLGQALARQGLREEALAVLQRHRELAPLLDELQFARQSLDLAPNHAPNRAQLADIHARLGQPAEAERWYAAAAASADAASTVPIALRHARYWSERRGDVATAVRLLEAAAERVPDSRLWVRAGDLLLRSDDPAGALARYERAQALRPQDPAIADRIRKARQP